MSFSRAVRVASNAPFTFLSILTLVCLVAAASVGSMNRLLTVSAAGKASVAQATAKSSRSSVGNSSTLTTNWRSSASSSITMNAPLAGTVPVAVSLMPDVTGPVGSIVRAPITVSDLTGLGVIAYDLQVTFNPAVLRPADTPYDKAGTVSSGMVITPNPNHTGHLIISAFQADYASGSGTLVTLMFVVVGLPGQSSGLTFEDYTDPIPRFHAGFRFNAGSPQVNTTNNSLMVLNAPTAAAAEVSGHVLTSDGQAVSGATVTLTGGAKAVRAITDSNGLYKVENLQTGGFYTVTPARANYTFAPSQRSFSLLGDRTDAVFTGLPEAIQSANPLDTAEYFVRQQYLDFLAREPDQGGLEYWSAQLAGCNAEASCLRERRIGVSAAFFVEQEFQQTGAFINGLYETALTRRPQYAEYTTDRRQVVGGSDVEGQKQAFADSFVERAEFVTKYQANTSAASFVDALLGGVQQSSGVDLSSQRQSLISLYETGSTQTNRRSLVLRAVTESAAVKEANYNAAFVLAEYFGYLRRNPDQGGFDFWLNVLNNSTPRNYRGMVCASITSTEYQLRFVTVASHSNAECGP